LKRRSARDGDAMGGGNPSGEREGGLRFSRAGVRFNGDAYTDVREKNVRKKRS
jgi:hypothetical protein